MKEITLLACIFILLIANYIVNVSVKNRVKTLDKKLAHVESMAAYSFGLGLSAKLIIEKGQMTNTFNIVQGTNGFKTVSLNGSVIYFEP